MSPRPGFAEELIKHGDGVKDVAFNVEDCRGIYQVCRRGATAVDSLSRSAPSSAAPRACASPLC